MSLLFAGVIAMQMQLQTQAKATVELNPVSVVEWCEPEYELMRVSLYIDKGTTKSGTTTRYGVVAGKEEWLGERVYIYRNDNGEVGDLIDVFTFEDTGYGIDTGDGVGTIQKGETIDVWLPDLKHVKSWQKEYGDYLYISFEQKK